MVNKKEKEIIEKYENDGWTAIRGGAPDFLFIRVNGGDIVDHRFVEAKGPNGRLTPNQVAWKKVLEDILGAKYVVEGSAKDIHNRLIKLPKRLTEEVDSILGYHGYTTRAQFVEDAIKSRLKEVRAGEHGA